MLKKNKTVIILFISFILFLFFYKINKEELYSCTNKSSDNFKCIKYTVDNNQQQYDAYYNLIIKNPPLDNLNNRSFYNGFRNAYLNCASFSNNCNLYDRNVIKSYMKVCALNTKEHDLCIKDYLANNMIDVDEVINLIDTINYNVDKDFFNSLFLILIKDEKDKSKKLVLEHLMVTAQNKLSVSDFFTYVFYYGKNLPLPLYLKDYLSKIDYSNKEFKKSFVTEYCDYFLAKDNIGIHEEETKKFLESIIYKNNINLKCENYNKIPYSKNPNGIIRIIK